MKTIAVLLLIIAALVGFVLVAKVAVQNTFGEEYERFRQVEEGMTEEQVRSLLGEPYRQYSRDSAPADYYVDGYSFKRRPITQKVLIYVGTEPIAYIYLDREGRVEEVFIGGS